MLLFLRDKIPSKNVPYYLLSWKSGGALISKYCLGSNFYKVFLFPKNTNMKLLQKELKLHNLCSVWLLMQTKIGKGVCKRG